ncbi:MAG TPA: hypothetical protein VMW22_06910 [Candidatus Desulfaltia sp.]|nr:hypothetical protein [Candidatus Desulfaltia sp.]
MNDPIVYVFLGYVVGVVLGLLGGLDAMVRAGRAGAKVTTRRQALRWLLGVPEKAE